MKRILFVTQTLDVTGSELVLVNILNNLNPKKIRAGVFICLQPGLLSDKLPKHVEIFSLQNAGKSIFSRLFRLLFFLMRNLKFSKALKKIFGIRYFENSYEKNLLKRIFTRDKYDFLYFNSIVFPELMSFAYQEKLPYILHTHELAHILANIPAHFEDSLVKGPAMILATSRAAAQVMRDLGRKTNLEVWNPGIDFQKLQSISPKVKPRIAARGGVQFHWLGSGYNDLNKNVLLFLHVAQHFVNSGLNVRFTWIGLGNKQLYDIWLAKYRDSLGLQKHVQFLEKQENNAEYYSLLATADAVMVPSFRESFSLVAIESIFLGIPVLTFANGGAAEYMSPQNGLVAENYDYADFISKGKQLMRRRKFYRRGEMGKSVAKFDIRTQITSWQIAMESLR